MKPTPYKSKKFEDAGGLQEWLLKNAGNNEESLARVKRNLSMAMQEELTPAQRKYLLAYYVGRKTMQEIGEEAGVDKSTVCKTIDRAVKKLYRVLRYSF